MNIILNIAAGKVLPIDWNKDKDILVNLDQTYFSEDHVEDIEMIHSKDFNLPLPSKIFYCNEDIYNFLERYKYTFDKIVMYRFLEHVPKVKVLYFLYILSTCLKIGGTVEVIVPDCKCLASRILSEDVNDKNFEADDIITTFELLNEPFCPHASLWHADRAKYFFELEGRFKVTDIETRYEFDGRDIYLKFIAKRIK